MTRRGPGIAATPEPPYVAVIFTSRLGPEADGYGAMARRMAELAAGQPGFLGMESAREGVGITVSYWRDEQAVAAWRSHLEHLQAQAAGRERFYAAYTVRVARVERDYGMP